MHRVPRTKDSRRKFMLHFKVRQSQYQECEAWPCEATVPVAPRRDVGWQQTLAEASGMLQALAFLGATRFGTRSVGPDVRAYAARPAGGLRGRSLSIAGMDADLHHGMAARTICPWFVALQADKCRVRRYSKGSADAFRSPPRCHACHRSPRSSLMPTRTRRQFLEDSMLAAAAAAVAAGSTTSAFADDAKAVPASPNEKLGVAVVGCGGRGSDHLKTFCSRPDTEVLYIVDIDENIAKSRAEIRGFEARPGAEDRGRHARSVRRQIGRCRQHGDSEPLARPGEYLGHASRQGRVRRKAGQPQRQ